MQNILAFLNANVAVIEGSLKDPVFLVCMLLAVVAAWGLNWGSGVFAVVLAAAARVGLIDWEQFAPGVPPSPNLVYIFTATLLAAMIIFVVVKSLYTFWRNARRRGAWTFP